ncbi:MAG: drug/metabolite transporter (DMT)-like permease [Verrucomicrobiales bacterium]|jgi:drug/metabolite transporter (DMT)-like permease
MGTLLPGLFFAFAEQRIESSVAGMVQSAGPLFVLAISIGMARKTPGRIQMIGLFIGFMGGVA